MSDVLYKKFSQLPATTELNNNDVMPVASFVSGTDYTSKKITYSTLYHEVSSDLISPFTTSIQTTVNSSLSSDKWNSTYTTVGANSAAWGATVTDTLTAFSQGNTTSSPMTVRYLSAGTTANASVAFIANGTGATLAHLPDGGVTGGNARGQYATDWQKARNDAAQVASGVYSVIGGGQRNKAATDYAVIGGGQTNSIIDTSTYASIGGGLQNTLSGDAVYGVIAGGYDNRCDKISTSILGGEGNRALSSYAAVVGGYGNTASGYSSLAGGYGNTASGNSSTALGTANDTNKRSNAHIIGSNMTAPSANFTYVNNISSQGDVRGANFYGSNIIKAWVNFNGTSTGGAAINSSYNVSSVTRNGAGDFTINFPAGVFANAFYLVMGGGSNNYGVTAVVDTTGDSTAPTLKTTTQCRINTKSGSGVIREPYEAYVMFIGL